MTSKPLLQVLWIVTVPFLFIFTPAARIKAPANPVQSGEPSPLSASNFSGNELPSSSMANPPAGPTGATAGGFKTFDSSQEAEVRATKNVDKLLARDQYGEHFDINGEDVKKEAAAETSPEVAAQAPPPLEPDTAHHPINDKDAVKEAATEIPREAAAEAPPPPEPDTAPEGIEGPWEKWQKWNTKVDKSKVLGVLGVGVPIAVVGVGFRR